MADTDSLRPYRATTPPANEQSSATFIYQELSRISASITTLVETMKKLEVRLVAGGL